MQRRHLITTALGTGLGLVAGCTLPASARAAAAASAAFATSPMAPPLDDSDPFASLEPASGGRLGVAWLDLAGGRVRGHRLDERFLLCSTFKALLAAQVLRRVERGEESLSARVAFARADLQAWSPVTAPAAARGGGLDVATLCAAAVSQSDNTAANLLLARSGGPAALTAWLRSIGDEVTRLDRVEPALNETAADAASDTTTPRAMATTMGRLLFGDALAPASRARLQGWMRATRTGTHRLRASWPAGWDAGDKTGTGGPHTMNDVAFLHAPGRSPWLVAAYLSSDARRTPVREETLADVGRVVAAAARR